MKIITLLNEGYSLRYVADKVKVNPTTCLRIQRRFRETGQLKRRPGSSGVRKTVPREDRTLKRLAKQNRKLPYRKLALLWSAQCQKQFSHETVRSRFSEMGLKRKKPQRKPLLTKRHKESRLQFAREHSHRTGKYWERVVFSDEKKFNVNSNDSGLYISMEKGEENLDECTIETKKFPDSVMMWGCCSGRGPGRLHIVQGTLNQQGYINILKGPLMETVREQFPNEKYIFQHDNASCHTAKSVVTFLRENDIETLSWPPNSPDLNPLENIWGIMISKLRYVHFTNRQELIAACNEIWYQNISREVFRDVILSMPKRIDAVLKAHGGRTKY